ncbi:hypothetical protein BV898_09302 [Hypsibius exemplaris]|uniref:Uncharacterized protein n=1 Tax=Hypsibius exemplaris TaxID=2072580 RepID=A0A1W0WND3_HYPEX|nr:hypothetical protein BV898_09302 [Hypsibius exemplaris]
MTITLNSTGPTVRGIRTIYPGFRGGIQLHKRPKTGIQSAANWAPDRRNANILLVPAAVQIVIGGIEVLLVLALTEWLLVFIIASGWPIITGLLALLHECCCGRTTYRHLMGTTFQRRAYFAVLAVKVLLIAGGLLHAGALLTAVYVCATRPWTTESELHTRGLRDDETANVGAIAACLMVFGAISQMLTLMIIEDAVQEGRKSYAASKAGPSTEAPPPEAGFLDSGAHVLIMTVDPDVAVTEDDAATSLDLNAHSTAGTAGTDHSEPHGQTGLEATEVRDDLPPDYSTIGELMLSTQRQALLPQTGEVLGRCSLQTVTGSPPLEVEEDVLPRYSALSSPVFSRRV